MPSGGPAHPGRTLRTLLPYLWPPDTGMRARVVIALICLGGAKGATVYVPVLFGDAVDALSPAKEDAASAAIAVPVLLILAYGLARILSSGLAELRNAVFVRVAQRAIRAVGMRTFRHLHNLSLRFHLDRRTGGISRAIERGTQGVEFLLNFVLFNIVPTALEIVLVAGVLWGFFNAWYALLIVGTVGLYAAYTVRLTEWRIAIRRRMNETESEAATRAIDSLLNYETVKYFNNEDHEAARFDEALKGYERAAIDSRSSLAVLNTGQAVIIAVGLVVIMLMAGYDVKSGAMTVGDFAMVNTYLLQLFIPLNFLGTAYREIRRSLADLEHMFDLLGAEPEVTDRPDAEPLHVAGGAVDFDNVWFGYHPERPVLKGVSFHVPPGHTVALVGPTGAGKSTIARLLFRFYDVTDGAVRLDGQDVRRVTQDSLRRAIGIVPQDTVLFNDTIGYNIAYGRPDATQEEVEHVARLARIHDFVASLPEGYETRVGERGLKLSGGEKQRVAIARTMLKDPPILVFDEATSALDTHTEKEIQAALNAVSSGRTTVMIAHRLSTVVHADEIIVLEDGQVAERGTHGDLLDKGGAYARLWERQQEGEATG